MTRKKPTDTLDSRQMSVQLGSISSDGLTEEQLEQAALLTGIDPSLLADANISIYTDTSLSLLGESGRTYTLNVQAEGKTCSAVTTIPHPVALDSLWWELALQDADDDSSGYAWARLTDPDTMGNGYRWMARRIYSDDPEAILDGSFISPLGSSFIDKYINGLTFDFFAVRGRSPYVDNSEDETAGWFLRGDSVIVKFVSMGEKEADFYITYDNNIASAGDLFSIPSNARTNIDGGLGIWAGWAPSYHTLVCQ